MRDAPHVAARIIRDMGDGLVLRAATAADAEALAAFNAEIHREPNEAGPSLPVAQWTRDLLAGTHPSVSADDFTLVEDTRSGAIVSSMCLLDQTWTYAGIPFRVGRPELVGTRPDFRNRGLVRAQFEVVHAWSAGRGQVLQAITGIPFYYRQFGYEMAVNLGGGRSGFAAQLPVLGEGQQEPYCIRPAKVEDLPLLEVLYAQHCARSLLACERDPALWRYEIDGRHETNFDHPTLAVIAGATGATVGMLLLYPRITRNNAGAWIAEIVPDHPWLDVAPSLLRQLVAFGASVAGREQQQCTGYRLALHADHPLYRAIPGWLPAPARPYAWYLRVPNLVDFLQRITPVLEKRLAASHAAGFTGDLTIGMYRSGVRLVIESGRLATVEAWQPAPNAGGKLQFPGLTFLQLLFGYRTLDELRYAFPDCRTDDEAAAQVAEALFPKQDSSIWPIE